MNRSLPSPTRRLASSITLVGCAIVAATHLWLLFSKGVDPVSAPVATLSRDGSALWHGAALVAFAVAHVALAFLIYRREGGRLHRAAVFLIAIASVLVVRMAFSFANEDPGDTTALWVLACTIGVAMGLLAPGLLRTHRRAARFNLVCLAIWIALMPAVLLVGEGWVGAYERLVGTVYAVWMIGLALLIGLGGARPEVPSEARSDTRGRQGTR